MEYVRSLTNERTLSDVLLLVVNRTEANGVRPKTRLQAALLKNPQEVLRFPLRLP